MSNRLRWINNANEMQDLGLADMRPDHEGEIKRNSGQRTVNLARLSMEIPNAITTFQHKDDSF